MYSHISTGLSRDTKYNYVCMPTLSVINGEHTPQLITVTLVTVKSMFRVKTTSQTEGRRDRTLVVPF